MSVMPHRASLGLLLDIQPLEVENEFWESDVNRKLASSLDWWYLWFTCVNNYLVYRFLHRRDLYAEVIAGMLTLNWVVVAMAQTWWRLHNPLSYFRWRSWVVTFNRSNRFITLVCLLLVARTSTRSLADYHAAFSAPSPFHNIFESTRCVLMATHTIWPFIHALNSPLPFRPQLLFHTAYLLLLISLASPFATRILTHPLPTPHPPPNLPNPTCPNPTTTLPSLLSCHPIVCALHSNRTSKSFSPHHATNLSSTPATLPPAYPSPIHPDSLQALCTSIGIVMSFTHCLFSLNPAVYLDTPVICTTHALQVLILFFHVYFAFLIPVYISYRLESHTKAKFLIARHLQLMDDSDPRGPSGVQPSHLCSLPHWTDALTLMLLAFISWIAATFLHDVSEHLQLPC